ncbi:hypothetical protein DAEQUDRAFT_673608 [Daedalea quercina L-15889]|uniref:Uncharacterized protein n=1 Tax=Daedalea quercina L-15889 TaxID=1314783 RepID=A0A165NPS8_9APHY|nr:hypothetical protein DAEQUDRAFT_673608 [Daedalea quercina L-15889]
MAYKPPHVRAHRVYQPGKRHMELMPSVSRSSGLDKDGHALKNRAVQEEYRAFIEEKVNEFWKHHPYDANESEADRRNRQEEQENILILFRKLREGLLATDRKDMFALEVYETSLHLAILFHSEKQTTSILSHLFPKLYLTSPGATDTIHTALSTALLSLLHHLVLGYPSQNRYHEHLHSLPRTLLPRDHPAHRWLGQLTRCLRVSNYARLQELTDHSAFEQFFLISISQQADRGAERPSNLALEAMCTLVKGILAKARATAWLIMRNAYREIHCASPPAGTQEVGRAELSPTSQWLARSLALRPLACGGIEVDDIVKVVDEWLSHKCADGEVRRKEGAQGRWIVCKVPVRM